MVTRHLDVTQGRVGVRQSGEGAPVVFLHGALVDAGRLWRTAAVVDPQPGRRRVAAEVLAVGPAARLAPGGDAPDADLTPPGLARLVAELLEALDLRDVTLVGNDTGGAIAQLVAAHHPERLGRLVLTPCDAFENFLPPAFKPLQLVGAHVPVRSWSRRSCSGPAGCATARWASGCS